MDAVRAEVDLLRLHERENSDIDGDRFYECACGSEISVGSLDVAAGKDIFLCGSCRYTIRVRFDDNDRGAACFFAGNFLKAVEFYVSHRKAAADDFDEDEEEDNDFNIHEALDDWSKTDCSEAREDECLQRYRCACPGGTLAKDFWFWDMRQKRAASSAAALEKEHPLQRDQRVAAEPPLLFSSAHQGDRNTATGDVPQVVEGVEPAKEPDVSADVETEHSATQGFGPTPEADAQPSAAAPVGPTASESVRRGLARLVLDTATARRMPGVGAAHLAYLETNPGLDLRRRGRAVKKRLRQIDELEEHIAGGLRVSPDQEAKLARRPALEAELAIVSVLIHEAET